MLSLQEPSRRGAPEPVQDEVQGVTLLPTTKQLLHLCLQDGGSPPAPGNLAEERTEFLHSQNSLSPRRCTLLAFPLLQASGKAVSLSEPPLLSPAPCQMRPQSCPTPPRTSSWPPRPSHQYPVLTVRHP